MGLFHSDRLEKLTLLGEGFVQIRREFTDDIDRNMQF